MPSPTSSAKKKVSTLSHVWCALRSTYPAAVLNDETGRVRHELVNGPRVLNRGYGLGGFDLLVLAR